MMANRQLYATLTNYHPPAGINDQKYASMLLTYFAPQDKRLLLVARQRQQDAFTDASQPASASMMQYPTNMEPLASRHSALDNDQMQLMLLEQHYNKRVQMARRGQIAACSGPSRSAPDSAEQDQA